MTVEQNSSLIRLMELFPELQQIKRYQGKRIIGNGAYAFVCEAVDTKTGHRVAIKKIREWDADPQEAVRTVREIEILKHFQGSQYLLQLEDVIKPDDVSELDDILLVTEKLKHDLDDKMKSKPIPASKRIQIMCRILCGLQQIHSAGVVHRDLRPKNVLISKDKVVLCDFGMGRTANNLNMSLLQYTTCSSYCAPEGFMKFSSYGPSVDMWAAACIWAEMITGKKLILPATYRHCKLTFLELILCFCQIKSTDGLDLSEDEAQVVNDCLARITPKDYKLYNLKRVLQDNVADEQQRATNEELDLLQKMFSFSTETRPTAEQCLKHSVFDKIRPANVKTFPPFEYNQPDFQNNPSIREYLFDEL